MSNVTLYYRPFCPFCTKVRDYLKSKNIEVPEKNITADKANLKELEQIGGKTQVPALLVNDKMIYESLDIIKWFDLNWA